MRSFNHLYKFHGGLHLPDNKAQSTQRPLSAAPIPPRLVLPLQQHIGEAAEPVVAVGDKVLKGQMIAAPQGYISVPVHASTSGTVVDIGQHPVPHPSGLKAPCIVIEADGEDRWIELNPIGDRYRELDLNELRMAIRDAGIVGLGGAGFPSFIKMNPGPRRHVDLLVINGAECEPYISCDDLLMRTHADDMLQGVAILMHALQVKQCVIGIEDNKPEAIEAVRAAVQAHGNSNIEVVVIPSLYPSGGERQLIKILTGQEVPSQGLPADIGVVCHNPGTAVAIQAAIYRGEPLISRIVTLTGQGIAEPQNLLVRIGTPMHFLVEQSGGYTEKVDRLLMGGPMMGFALQTDELPLIKTTNCLLATSRSESPAPPAPLPCIRCGQCADACPADLLPQQLFWYARARDFDKAQDYNLFDCIECGCCAYVCPSHIPLVQYYRFAKTEVWAQERERDKADVARQRHEFRLERLEREQQERAAKLRKKKEAIQGDKKDSADDKKKAAIQAALDRAKAKKAANGVAPKNTENLTSAQQEQIKAADARRTAAKQPKDNN